MLNNTIHFRYMALINDLLLLFEGKCEPQSCDIGVTIKTFDFVLTGNETNLQVSVLKTPVVASIDASHISFQEYVSKLKCW